MNEHLYKFIDEKGSQHLMLHENGLWTKIEWQREKRRGESRVILLTKIHRLWLTDDMFGQNQVARLFHI